ncbi:MAG TPA: LysM peptidoglycan-binding domain-containing protein [Dermatophilaceae bacterium]|nr:LysM peptidoglycan-binding domain-containing protein [Dermatophilaceae bacterium]
MSTVGAAAVWGPVGPVTANEVRLTRRGRLARSGALVALVGLLVLSLMDVVGGGRALAADSTTPRPVSTRTVVVEQGDSLWLIAGRTAPDADPREVVTRIRELNGMRSNLIQPGQALLVPSTL